MGCSRSQKFNIRTETCVICHGDMIRKWLLTIYWPIDSDFCINQYWNVLKITLTSDTTALTFHFNKTKQTKRQMPYHDLALYGEQIKMIIYYWTGCIKSYIAKLLQRTCDNIWRLQMKIELRPFALWRLNNNRIVNCILDTIW